MKHKTIISIIAIITMFALAAIIYENAPAIASLLRWQVRTVDTTAAGVGMMSLIASIMIGGAKEKLNPQH